MKLLAIIFIAVISVSSVLPSSGEATTIRCPEGHRVDGLVCRRTAVGTRSCRADNLPNLGGEEECIVSDKNCNIPDLSTCNRRLAGENLGEPECEDGFENDDVSRNCIRIVDHGEPNLECDYIVTADGKCKVGFIRVAVCEENSSSAVGCLSRRYKRDNGVMSCVKNYNETIDSKTGEPLCVFIEESPTRFCENGTEFDVATQICLSDSDVGRRSCNLGNLVDGRCKEALTSPRKYSCPQESDLSDVTACFRGIVKGKRCLVSERAETYLNCPPGYSPVDGSTSTMCQSETSTNPIPL